MKHFKLILFLGISFLFYTCISNKEIYNSSSSRNSLRVLSDTTILYSKIWGCIGTSKTFHYTKTNNTLKIENSTFEIDKKDSSLNSNDLYNKTLFYSKDSIKILETNEVFYTKKMSKKISKKRNKQTLFYIIIDSKKIKVNHFNIKSISSNFNNKTDTIIEINKDTAYVNYKIPMKYNTIEIRKK